MTKIVFNNTNNDGFIQGMRPNVPAHSELRRTEERKECTYTDIGYGYSEQRPMYDYREPAEDHYPSRERFERQPPRNDRYLTPNERARSSQSSRKNNESNDFAAMIKGIPLWAISAINCSMGLMTLFIPCLIMSISLGLTSTMGYHLDLLSLLLSDNSAVVSKYTTAQTWQLLVPTVISAVMTIYFLLMRENSFSRAYIPAAAGIASMMMSVMYFINVENSMHNFLIDVECGFGVYVSMLSSLVLIILSIAAAIVSKVSDRNGKNGGQRY